ncbi:riboflavin synthase [Microvenator marinus]|jgi:riboflavin synthase|uniref:Riboflavin synthase n=1 Tax=Microvenator marinus TaxID=2600177 RepID=A0A5B8Y1S2_9DELT|nr:riboflavin synthase [Microvenator marinus]QED29619.1 riboflavin synthase [Microvenator marinus]
MFTGLITDIGVIRDVKGSRTKTLRIETSYDTKDIELGESIAVDGVCLTVTEIQDRSFSVDAGWETLEKTAIGRRGPGSKVHLERALALGDRLGGHWVSGHVDGVGRVTRRQDLDKSVLLEFSAPSHVAELLVEKGSIAIDGVSLTVNTVDGDKFTVAIIPYTQGKTHLLDLKVSDEVNLESDILGKYVRKLLGRSARIDEEFLKANGFSVE